MVKLFNIDFRVGRCVKVALHPERDGLFILDIDLGEAKHRKIVSGLAQHLKDTDLLNKFVVIIANLKPSKFAGVLSEGMLLTAYNQEKTKFEILEASSEVKLGEQIVIEGYENSPADILNPKQKLFEKVQVYMRTDSDKNACFHNVKLMTSEGPIFVQSLHDALIG